ncbi:hypothetical protein N7478_007703 [Penicillium angulare]|uniref:uncharacterized protein n=1 Tax=Penicillium angulare TaxID=116970 RepID=UPI00253FD8C9|nr:uncharacterized protein N7478_007703 [Penicillium angulare]KAJ5272578.1 hypothetical protein N7478_007703 [Penicillium angulare]
MLGVQRKFGRLTTKRTADDSQVAVLLKDFEDADMLLTKIVDNTKAWRDAWTSIATFQSRMADEFDGLYAPMLGSSEEDSDAPPTRQPAQTSPAILARTNRIRREFDELRTDMIQELCEVDTRMTQPAVEAKSYLAPMKKTIKKRNDKKTDFERFQSRHDGLVHKQKRSERDNANLAKAEMDLASAKEIYRAADEDLCQRLPTLISLLFSLAPHILHAQIEIQNRMLAHYYTVLHTYCEEEGFPSPPPPMDHVVQDWEIAHKPNQDELEGLSLLAHGKAIRQYDQNQNSQGQPGKRPSFASVGGRSLTNLSVTSRSSRSKSPAPPPNPNMLNKPKPCGFEASRPVSPSSSIMTPTPSVSVLSAASSNSTAPYGSDYFTPPVISPEPGPQPVHPHFIRRDTSPMPMKPPKPSGIQFSPAGPKIDHHQAFVSRANTAPASAMDPLASLAGQKKRPPPPPPAKPAKPPRPTTTFVTAMYDFGGQGPDDLSFREGDRIKLVKKTGSTDDWWQGELGGVQGYFPANYVEM